MSDKEREAMYKACCQICTLAEVMKACQKCPFRIGLQTKEQKEIKKP